jgi:hypothetical protein
MTKPAITSRTTKGAALTYAELDTNFSNLRDATIAVTGDTGTITNNLNDSFQIAGGTGLTSSVSGTVLTVNLDNTAVTPGSYTTANITVDAQGRITSASNGSGGAYAFSTISVSGQSDVVADQLSDTLTLVAGTGVTLTTDPTTDSITITSVAGSNSFGNISNGTVTKSATTTNDTITFLPGTNITITPISGSPLGYTIAAAGGTGTVSSSANGSRLAWYSNSGTTITPITAGLFWNASTNTLSSTYITTANTITAAGLTSAASTSLTIWAGSGGSGTGANIQMGAGANSSVSLVTSGTGKVELAGLLKIQATATSPSNGSTVSAWLGVTIGSTLYHLPLYL